MTHRSVKHAVGLGAIVAAAMVAGVWAGPALSGSPEAGSQARVAKALPVGRSPGKPRPPVQARLLQSQGLQPGVPASLLLQVQVGTDIEILEVQVEGSDGLLVVSVSRSPHMAPPAPSAGSQAAGEPAQWQIAATPAFGGTQTLSGLVTFSVNGVRQAAPFSLPVQVGGSEVPPAAPSRKPMGSLTTAPDGELIDSMPAETTVW